jgi:hypothetical protein
MLFPDVCNRGFDQMKGEERLSAREIDIGVPREMRKEKIDRLC